MKIITQRLALVFLLGTSCSMFSERPRADLTDIEYPWKLLSVNSIKSGLFWRQQISASFDNSVQSFQAVLQTTEDSLLVVGLSPMGTKTFVLKQTGTDSDFKKFTEDRFPIPELFVLIDIQRCFFSMSGAGIMQDGIHEINYGGERIEEEWRNKRIVQRRFFRDGMGESGACIRVSYFNWSEDGEIPQLTILENQWFGYSLTIKSFSGR